MILATGFFFELCPGKSGMFCDPKCRLTHTSGMRQNFLLNLVTGRNFLHG